MLCVRQVMENTAKTLKNTPSMKRAPMPDSGHQETASKNGQPHAFRNVSRPGRRSTKWKTLCSK
jgi:hypothetical protein